MVKYNKKLYNKSKFRIATTNANLILQETNSIPDPIDIIKTQ